MATADEYAAWIVKNSAKRGTPEFDTVAQAYQIAKAEELSTKARLVTGQNSSGSSATSIAGIVKQTATDPDYLPAIAGSLGNLAGKTSYFANKLNPFAKATTQGVAAGVGKAIPALGKMSNKSYDAAVRIIEASGTSPVLTRMLKGAIGKDGVARNAALFMVSQNPAARAELEAFDFSDIEADVQNLTPETPSEE